jgi:hypothetical protein
VLVCAFVFYYEDWLLLGGRDYCFATVVVWVLGLGGAADYFSAFCQVVKAKALSKQ